MLDVMKFHHLGQHLLDTNCLLLILKMFGLQEVSASVVSKADSPDNKYVRYLCAARSSDCYIASSGTALLISPRTRSRRAQRTTCRALHDTRR